MSKLSSKIFADLSKGLSSIASDISTALNGEQNSVDNITLSVDDNEPVGKVKYCVNCGNKLEHDSKFCMKCGQKIEMRSSEVSQPNINNDAVPPIPPAVQNNDVHITVDNNDGSRKQKYVGEIFKCPNCGEVISQTTAICPTCGMKITGQKVVNSLAEFSSKLLELQQQRTAPRSRLSSLSNEPNPADVSVINLIKSYPIPNSIDDILEFTILSCSNINVKMSKKSFMNDAGMNEITRMNIDKHISNAWVDKLKQAYNKAKIMFPEDKMFKKIEDLYVEKMKELKML